MGIGHETGKSYQGKETSKDVRAPYDFLSKEACKFYFEKELNLLIRGGCDADFNTVIEMARAGAQVIEELDNAEFYLRFRIASKTKRDAFKEEAFGRLMDLEAYYQEFLINDAASV